MGARLIRCLCPHCSCLVVEAASASAWLMCPHCCNTFRPSVPKKIPFWVYGVLVFLGANLGAIIMFR